ncbi:hypothetical protein EHI8A_242020 [Entamoeba histolytica HM-1:IMSS-B]|uniref:Uncharacterized protein n=5 Tax=Entamoeba histolytica TaxID=5759 RepID=C4MAU2_ENTH1|nr:hypothetical protein EHI_127670 [Entamoeba histolytica HM-1:IMSS]EMD43796.1 Hypothetical protein EHI5A_143130 [Entamoeba histolytica KU27]EMH76727.1 hypothetical protein EHI8A_242020 [Entamoeba histolytica HM-1:IMSS-B]ENY63827.1 hypothetical protein EHI7A_193290 [Entamoeba histolytica HM-1:IMSS-A]GAT98971.1 hypothetical protein CL6EHI_127670 [Entamoeba histolytica]EAL44018.1 hypothetical protein EHI_127670 [Entamoeba histolytica HM-1:IMSS]|eukprot:XP_649405.1 hypothetical protein EHI_127670 [Entamoeba histolytica HM-1:IMSS]
MSLSLSTLPRGVVAARINGELVIPGYGKVLSRRTISRGRSSNHEIEESYSTWKYFMWAKWDRKEHKIFYWQEWEEECDEYVMVDGSVWRTPWEEVGGSRHVEREHIVTCLY